MSRTIELPDEVYRDLETVAVERGISIADCISEFLPKHSEPVSGQNLLDLLGDAVGSVESSAVPENDRVHTPYSDLLAEKFRKQGLRIP